MINPIIEDFKTVFLTFVENLRHDFIASGAGKQGSGGAEEQKKFLVQIPSPLHLCPSASSSDDTPPDNLTQEENPATATINVTAVEVPELTEQEVSDRLLLERKVERAFFEAGNVKYAPWLP
ncbi:hypothetical protein LC612_35885 [Nostoc sp. CHAB 5834]|nr:hypothetical protein [Nostoc sp. CHAB 5834]